MLGWVPNVYLLTGLQGRRGVAVPEEETLDNGSFYILPRESQWVYQGSQVHGDARAHDVILAGTEKVLLPKIDPPARGCLAFPRLGTVPERPAVPSDTLPTGWPRPGIPALN